jgi:hypothetical protein
MRDTIVGNLEIQFSATPIKLFGVEKHQREENDDDGEELDETQTDECVRKQILLHRWVPRNTNDEGGEELTHTLCATADGDHSDSATQSCDTGVTHA